MSKQPKQVRKLDEIPLGNLLLPLFHITETKVTAKRIPKKVSDSFPLWLRKAIAAHCTADWMDYIQEGMRAGEEKKRASSIMALGMSCIRVMRGEIEETFAGDVSITLRAAKVMAAGGATCACFRLHNLRGCYMTWARNCDGGTHNDSMNADELTCLYYFGALDLYGQWLEELAKQFDTVTVEV